MELIRKYFTLQRENFSGVVSISKNNKVIFEEAYGFADKERNVRNTVRTKFYVGSMLSKPITSVCILQLMEQGRLSLSQEIDEFFPSFKGKGITIQHLLNHTSGIVNYFMLRNKIKWNQDYLPEQILQIVEQEKLKFLPGKKSSYNNTGYLMLGLLIEQITGMSYPQYVREFVLNKAEMNNTSFIRDEVDDVALNYINHKKGFYISPTVLFACGEICSTVEDVHRFVQALKEGILVSKETCHLMEQPTYEGKYATIGSGWFIKKLFSRKSVCHGGTHPGGYTSHLERYIEDDVTIIVLSNNMVRHSRLSIKELGGTLICREIAAIFFNGQLRFWQKII